jgi:hypothetical protein
MGKLDKKFIKKILIISPHYPPSNLAAVHRSRLFAQHLPEYGWEPVVLTVDERYYEENPDWNLHGILPPGQRVEKSTAFGLTKPRLIGDIGLRAFFQLRQKALELLRRERFDFVYIPIPSFYVSLIGPWLKKKTGVPYGIDYIDPWVHRFPGSEKILTRHWWSTKLSRILEPKAVRDASLITGVAEGYYRGVIERNPDLKKTCLFGAMPYGGEIADHRYVQQLDVSPYLFSRRPGMMQLVYAGAMLPKAYEPLEQLFTAIRDYPSDFSDVEFHFVGTGKKPYDPQSYNIRPLAEKYGLWEKTVFEYPARIPYLDVLVHLNAADGIFILGSTEPHYTPSKVFQAVLSQKPILAVLHQDSTALRVIGETGAGVVLPIDLTSLEEISTSFPAIFGSYRAFCGAFNPSKVKLEQFNPWTAKEVTRQLAMLLDLATA